MSKLNSSVKSDCESLIPFIKISKKLGSGNFASVFLGVHKITHSKVAIKVVDKKLFKEESATKVIREANSMQKLNHPNIARLLQFAESDEIFIIVMEYVSRGELYTRILNNGPIVEPRARKYYRQIISAVHYIHSKGIVHRDLKTENLMIDSHDNIKLVDFGFSNFFDRKKRLTTFCGSPPYAAPELFMGKAYYGPEVDIWSLGVILYVMLTGVYPFESKTLSELVGLVTDCNFRTPMNISRNARNLIYAILMYNPEDRIKMEDIMNHPWITCGYQTLPLAEFTFKDVDYCNFSIINKIKSRKIWTNFEITKSLDQRHYNDIMATYLLFKKDWPHSGMVNSSTMKKLSKHNTIQENILKKFRCLGGIISNIKSIFSASSKFGRMEAVYVVAKEDSGLCNESPKSDEKPSQLTSSQIMKRSENVETISSVVNDQTQTYNEENHFRLLLIKESSTSSSNSAPDKSINLTIQDSSHKIIQNKSSTQRAKSWKIRRSKVRAVSAQSLLNNLCEILSEMHIKHIRSDSDGIYCAYHVPMILNTADYVDFIIQINQPLFKNNQTLILFKLINGDSEIYEHLVKQIELKVKKD